eukprot:g4723.t1
MSEITQNIVARLIPDFTPAEDEKVVLEVLKREKTASGRAKLLLGDGKGKIPAAGAKSLTSDIKTGCLIELVQFSVNEMNGANVILLTEAKVVRDPVKVKSEPLPSSGVKENVDSNSAEATLSSVKSEPMQVDDTIKKEPTTPAGKNSTKIVGGVAPTPPARKTPCTLPRSTGTPAREMPIKALNPYNGRWTIRARVTCKSDLKEWSNSRGAGKLFSTNLLDHEGTEIRATFFNEGVDKYFDQLEEGGVYTFSKGRVKVANTSYTSICNQYEINFDENAVICQCDDDSSIDAIHFNFVTIDKLEETSPNSTIDVVGIVHSHTAATSLTTRSGKELLKRDLVLVDSSSQSVRCTLWGNKASLPDENFQGYPVVALKGCKLSEYGGRTIGTYASTTLVFNPSIEKTKDLRAWYDENSGSASSFTSVSVAGAGGSGGGIAQFEQRMLCGDIVDSGLGQGEKPDYVTIKACIHATRIEKGPWYPACPEEGNNKKLVQRPDGTWFCEANQKAYDKPEYRYILPLCVSDSSGQQWITAFSDFAQMIVGKSANEMQELMTNDKEKFEAEMKERILFRQFVMRLRVKEERYNDQARMRMTIMRCQPVKYVLESRQMISAIQKML